MTEAFRFKKFGEENENLQLMSFRFIRCGRTKKGRFLRQIENGLRIKNPKVNEHFVSLNKRYHSLAAGVKTLAKNLAKNLVFEVHSHERQSE